MKSLPLCPFFSFLALIFVALPGPGTARAQRAAEPMMQPVPATMAPSAPAAEGEVKKRAPAQSRKVSPRKMEIQTCTPDVRKIAPEGCLTPGGGVVTITGSCFGKSPGPYGAALKTGRGEIRKLDHRKWRDGSITLTLPPIPALAPGAGGVLGIASSSSEWFDGEPFTVCAATARVKEAPKATKQIVGGGKVPGATLKGSVVSEGAGSKAVTKASPDLGNIPSTPPRQGGAIGQKLYNDPPLPPKITVTRPAAGEELMEGETHLIQWIYQGLPETSCVRLELYRGKPFRDVIRENVCGTSTNWYVPGVPYGSYYNVRAEVIGTNVIDHSELFTMRRRIADAVIDIPRVNPSAPRAGENVTFRARIYNKGGEVPTQNSATLNVTGPQGYHETYTYSFPHLLPGDPSSLFIVNESYRVPAPGAYYNELSVQFSGPFGDPLPPVTATVPLYADEGLPDLVACLHSTWYVSTGVTKTVPIYVKNIGVAASEATMMSFYMQGKGIVHREVPPLDPDESVQVPYSNKWWVVGDRSMIASVDPNDTVDELGEGNNRRCATLKRRHGKVYNFTNFPPCSDTKPCSTVMPAGN